MALLRLDKLLASTGRWSRSEVKELIRQGRISVDGVPARSPADKYNADASHLCVDGETIAYSEYTYVMLHKPAGILSATEDKRQQTVLDLLPQELRRRGLFPVGRLDKDTEGLLLLTNDGTLAHELLSPKKHVDKVYFVRTDGTLVQEDCTRFAEGMQLGDGLVCLPAQLQILSAGAQSEALVTLREGKFHQIKRMLSCCGKPVVYLKRLRMGGLKLDESLARGEYRFLTADEIGMLRG